MADDSRDHGQATVSVRNQAGNDLATEPQCRQQKLAGISSLSIRGCLATLLPIGRRHADTHKQYQELARQIGRHETSTALCASDRDPLVDTGDDELKIASRPVRQPVKALLLDAAIGHSECHSLGSGRMAVSGSDRGAPLEFHPRIVTDGKSDGGSPVGKRALRTRTAYSRSPPGLRVRPIRRSPSFTSPRPPIRVGPDRLAKARKLLKTMDACQRKAWPKTVPR